MIKEGDRVQVVDKLLEKPCYIIDFLPRQVPEDGGGQFFEVEDYFLNHVERYRLQDRFIRILLKIMCYYPVAVHWREWIEQPAPGQIVEIMDIIFAKHSGDMNMLITSKDVLIQFGSDCLNISIYNPDDEMCELLEQIATSEGMFWRKAE